MSLSTSLPVWIVAAGLTALLGVVSSAKARQAGDAAVAGPVRVEVVQKDGKWTLLRGGQVYTINGAGGSSRLDELKAAGGNSIRTWSSNGIGPLLDRAHSLGLSVMVGLPMTAARKSFNYADTALVRAQLDRVLAEVRLYKDHPAVLMWGLGNELELAYRGDDTAIWKAVEQAAREIKAIDPNHPTVAVVAGIRGGKAGRIARLAPSVDILGINAYGELAHVPKDLDEQGWTKPYVVTEFGPRGWWEVETTEWNAQLEPTSTEKAATYKAGFEAAITGQPGRCFGSYVFLWGNKQEATKTWFGMWLPSGEPTEIVDTMTKLWTGSWPADRAPSVGRILSEAALATVPPNREFTARIEATDPEGGPLTTRWVVVAESTDRKQGGDPEQAPPEFPELTLATDGLSCTFRTPAKTGAYRLFVTVLDKGRRAATANVPFYVRDR